MVPIVLVAAVWAWRWFRKTVVVQCNNSAVVDTPNKDCCRHPDIMHLVRSLAFLRAKFQFTLTATHIEGTCNVLANALSRDKLDLFSHFL